MQWQVAALTMPDADPGVLLARGTLLIELSHEPQATRHNLLRYAARDPLPAGLVVALDPDGTLCLFRTAGDQTAVWSLPLPLPEVGETLTITHAWDADGAGHLTCWFPQRGLLRSLPLQGCLPLTAQDGARLLGPGAWTRRTVRLHHLALADHVVPPAPLLGIGPRSPVATPQGPQPLGALRAGSRVLLARGGTAQVLWTGPICLPPVGLTAPYLLRAPYLGLTETIALSGDQRLRLRGDLIEYIFDTEEVALGVRHLADDRSVIAVQRGKPVVWRQLVIDQPGPVLIAGLALEPLDPAVLRQTPGAPAHDLLAALPTSAGPSVPLLRDYEATTLRRMRAA